MVSPWDVADVGLILLGVSAWGAIWLVLRVSK
jgi:hypothetical protein